MLRRNQLPGKGTTATPKPAASRGGGYRDTVLLSGESLTSTGWGHRNIGLSPVGFVLNGCQAKLPRNYNWPETANDSDSRPYITRNLPFAYIPVFLR